MDQEIEELKELVRQNTKVVEDTNRAVHGMRRSARWSMVFRVLWWVIILGITAATYAYFAPYLQSVLDLYSSIGSGDFFKNFTPQ